MSNLVLLPAALIRDLAYAVAEVADWPVDRRLIKLYCIRALLSGTNCHSSCPLVLCADVATDNPYVDKCENHV